MGVNFSIMQYLQVYSNGIRSTVSDSVNTKNYIRKYLPTPKNSARKHVQAGVEVSIVVRKYG